MLEIAGNDRKRCEMKTLSTQIRFPVSKQITAYFLP